MRKEILFAIIAGILLGLVVAFGVWRTNSALKPENELTATSASDIPPSEPSVNLSLSISEPEDRRVYKENKANIIGLSKPNVWIAISAENDDYITQADQGGKFEQQVELIGGVNQIVITSIEESGATNENTLTLIYSSEFEKEVGSENSEEIQI